MHLTHNLWEKLQQIEVLDLKLVKAILFIFSQFICGVGIQAWDHGDDATVSTTTTENLPLFSQPNLSRLAASLCFYLCPFSVPSPHSQWWHFWPRRATLTFCSQIFNHSQSSFGQYAPRSISVDVSELLNQHVSWGLFHILFKFSLKLWVMPQKALLTQRTREGIIIKRKKLFTIRCNVLGEHIGKVIPKSF